MSDPGKKQMHPLVEDFPWGRLGRDVATAGRMADKARRAMRRLAEWGLRAPPDNRLERAARHLEAAHARGPGDPAPASAEILSESARTAMDFYLIAHAASELPEPAIRDKVMEALAGGDLTLSQGDRHARDTQFELVIWAMLKIGDVKVCVAEPDLRIEFEGAEYGIAVKRVWSLDQARRRLSGGARQIAVSGMRGVIATNIQEYLDPTTAEGELIAKGNAFNVHVRRMHGHLSYLADKPQVIGLLLSGTAMQGARADSERRFEMASFTQVLLFADTDVEQRMKRLFDRVGAALARWYADNL